jgi:hypothetical protein
MDSPEKAVLAQQKENETMRAMLKEQAAKIQDVSAALAVTRPSARLVTDE